MSLITIAQGQLQGVQHTLPNGRVYHSFKGIPYAKPPLGKLRFKIPQAPESWNGIRDATNFGDVCPQFDFVIGQVKPGSEDCLYINVYTPQNETHKELLPVMFFIHGGGFFCGYGDDDLYGPEPLMFEDVVLVTFNYRLGPLGFLCLDIPEVPGNMGMKDQVAALKWVQQNIKQFGGNPNNVTIFGESAGSASVTFHIISPMSEGLFHKAIAQSGAITNHWASEPDQKQRAFNLGRKLGITTDDPYKLLEFLEKVPASEFIDPITPILLTENVPCNILCAFIPVVEKVKSEQTFLSESAIKKLQQGTFTKVPTMTGYTSAEALLVMKNASEIIKYRTMFNETAVPRNLYWQLTISENIKLGKKIHKHYFGNEPITFSKALIDLESDTLINYGVYKFADELSRHNNDVYFYIFNCNTDRNVIKDITKAPDYEGVCHADDLPYLFQTSYNKPLDMKADSFEQVRLVTGLWTNFAKTGNPTPDANLGITWKKFSNTEKDYMIIDKELKMAKCPNESNFNFWDALYAEAEKLAKP